MSSPMLLATGTLHMTIDPQVNITFKKQTGIDCPSDKVPYISISDGVRLEGLNAVQLIGHCAVIVDNRTKTVSYCIVGDITTGIQLSKFAMTQLGVITSTYTSDFTIFIFGDTPPVWKSDDIAGQIVTEGMKLGSYLQTTYTKNLAAQVVESGKITTDNISAYIATLNRKSRDVSFVDLPVNKVCGVIIEAGRLFDEVHKKVVYRSPALESQVSQASKHKIPWGLYTEVRARNTTEAKEEVTQLSYCLLKYPPALGVWLRLKLTTSKTISGTIIDTYYTELVKLGFKGKVGFYVTPKELSTIDWNTYKDTWLLWLIEPISNVSELDVITPEFFDV